MSCHSNPPGSYANDTSSYKRIIIIINEIYIALNMIL